MLYLFVLLLLSFTVKSAHCYYVQNKRWYINNSEPANKKSGKNNVGFAILEKIFVFIKKNFQFF